MHLFHNLLWTRLLRQWQSSFLFLIQERHFPGHGLDPFRRYRLRRHNLSGAKTLIGASQSLPSAMGPMTGT